MNTLRFQCNKGQKIPESAWKMLDYNIRIALQHATTQPYLVASQKTYNENKNSEGWGLGRSVTHIPSIGCTDKEIKRYTRKQEKERIRTVTRYPHKMVKPLEWNVKQDLQGNVTIYFQEIDFK
jgi:hypothetical protein